MIYFVPKQNRTNMRQNIAYDNPSLQKRRAVTCRSIKASMQRLSMKDFFYGERQNA